MKTILNKLSKEQAQKQLSKFLILGMLFAAVSLVAFGIIFGTVGIAVSGRALLLTYHAGNAKQPNNMVRRVAAVLSLTVAAFSLVATLAAV